MGDVKSDGIRLAAGFTEFDHLGAGHQLHYNVCQFYLQRTIYTPQNTLINLSFHGIIDGVIAIAQRYRPHGHGRINKFIAIDIPKMSVFGPGKIYRRLP